VTVDHDIVAITWFSTLILCAVAYLLLYHIYIYITIYVAKTNYANSFYKSGIFKAF
jgi:hypothetical protein